MNSHRQLANTLAQLDPNRITVGRELRALTKKALAEKIGKTPSAITQFETGRSGMDVETFASLLLALNLPPAFFIKRFDAVSIDFGSCHFRALKSISQSVRRKAIQHAAEVVEVYRALEERGVLFPDANISLRGWDGYNAAQIEKLALEIRREWGLGNGPISNMATLLESMGVFVVLLPEDCGKLDAFAFWAEGRPCIAISSSMPASRLQFDLGHELCHLIFHEDEEPGNAECERAANHFSGAFCAPYPSFQLECPRSWNYRGFLELKKRWHLAMQACLYRARQIHLVSESSFRWGMVDLSKRGERTAEAGEFEKPLPTMLAKALEMIQGDFFLDELAGIIGLNPGELEALLRTQNVSQSILEGFKINAPERIASPVLRLQK